MEGYKTKEYGQPVKRYVQTMELKDSPELIKRYCEAHDKEHAWKEILAGIREVGILEMEIYILGNRLVMIVDAPLDFVGQCDEAFGNTSSSAGVGGVRGYVPRL